MEQIEFKRVSFEKIVIDIAWKGDDLIFHFYSLPRLIFSLDKKLDPLFIELFNLTVINKDELIEKHKNEIIEILNKQKEKFSLFGLAKEKYKEFDDMPGIHKSFIDTAKEKYMRDNENFQSWCYIIKNPDKLFLVEKIDQLLKKISQI